MTHDQAKEVIISNISTWEDYQKKVWQSTEDFLESADINELHDREIIIKPFYFVISNL